jgi:hypothetical protein
MNARSALARASRALLLLTALLLQPVLAALPAATFAAEATAIYPPPVADSDTGRCHARCGGPGAGR